MENSNGFDYRCRRCFNYQPYEPDAGLLEGCTADELYADEDGQEIIPEIDDKITRYMQNLGYVCPYFKDMEDKS